MKTLKNYVNGEWVAPESTGEILVDNPSTEEVLCKVPISTEAEAAKAVEAAYKAFPGWAATPVPKRIPYLMKLKQLLIEDLHTISRLIVNEMGKSIDEAEREVNSCIVNIDMACSMPHLIKGEKSPLLTSDIDTETLKLPVGVFSLICPFNFPAMVPFWFLPYAIASGNTFILKPSEQTPMALDRIFSIIDKLGLPPGVVNCVHGDKTASTELIENDMVSGVSFVGSSHIAGLIYEKCAEKRKRCQAMGSAKNYLVVMPDADVGSTIDNIIKSCFGCTGQRCMAATIVACVGDEIHETIRDRFVEAAKEIVVGNPLDLEDSEQYVMGPVISERARQSLHDCIETALQEGADLVLDGRETVGHLEKGYFIGPTILDNVKTGSTIEKTEVFGPVICMIKFETLEQAIQAVNDHQYGNGASFYTKNDYAARTFGLQAKVGMVGINVGVPAPVASFPFGGTKDSFYGDIKAQGPRVVDFFTEEKIITHRFVK